MEELELNQLIVTALSNARFELSAQYFNTESTNTVTTMVQAVDATIRDTTQTIFEVEKIAPETSLKTKIEYGEILVSPLLVDEESDEILEYYTKITLKQDTGSL